MSIINLLDCALSNLESPSHISLFLAKLQIKQYLRAKELGYHDSDDINEIIERHPELAFLEKL